MPRIEIEKIPAQQIASYPRNLRAVISGREKQRIGDAAGLTQFGVNVTRIKAGSASALRHWHEQEDEFIYMIEGELVLQENDGETVLKPGDAAGFKAGSGIAHCLHQPHPTRCGLPRSRHAGEKRACTIPTSIS